MLGAAGYGTGWDGFDRLNGMRESAARDVVEMASMIC